MGGPITAHAGRDHLRVLSSFSCKLSFRFTLDEKKLECLLRAEYLELREATAFSGDVRRFERLSGAPFDERNLLRILFPDPAPLVSLWLLDAFPALACSSVRILVTDAVMLGLSYPKYLETLKKELERCKLLIVPVGSGETRRIFGNGSPEGARGGDGKKGGGGSSPSRPLLPQIAFSRPRQASARIRPRTRPQSGSIAGFCGCGRSYP